MAWRKWFVRGLVFSIVAGVAGAAYLYQHWTNPVAVRQQVIAKLQEIFPGAVVTLDSARLRLFGGIALSELRLARRDDPDKTEIVHVPSAVLYHDKEKLLDGVLTFRKVELHRPRLRLVREPGGGWNLQGLTVPVTGERAIPTVVIHQGTLFFDDRLNEAKLPTLEIGEVNLTVLNDPLPVVTLDGTGTSEIGKSLRFRGTWNRHTKEVTVSAQAAAVQVTPSLLQRLCPPCAQAKLSGLLLEARADVKADFGFTVGGASLPSYDVRCRLTQGKLQHPSLPVPLEGMEASLRLANGQVELERLEGRSGAARIHARGAGLLPCPEGDFEGSVEVKHLDLCDGLFARLPERLQLLHKAFQPAGTATLRINCARRAGQWVPLASGGSPKLLLQPEDLRVSFTRFPYPLERLSGTLDYNLLSTLVQVNVTGYTGRQPVFIKGTWLGTGDALDATFDLHGNDLPIDDKLVAGLQYTPALQKLARSFNATGKVDIKAHLRHVPGTKEFQNEYHVRFHEATVKWDDFPYPLDNVHGFLDIYPRHWEFRDFEGTNNGARVSVSGRSVVQSGTDKSGMALEISGKNVNLDGDLKRALQTMPALAKVWDVFAPAGRMNFAAKIDRVPDQPQEIDVAVEVRGCAIAPHFFPYVLHDLSGKFRYHDSRLEMTQVAARHNGSQINLAKGTVDLDPGGGYYADLKDFQAYLLPDEDFLAALPDKLKAACEALKLHDPLTLKSWVVVSQSSQPGSRPQIFWDGQAWLDKAKLQTGLEWSNITGTVACRGLYDGQELKGLNGNVLLDEAVLLKQPFRNLSAKVQVKEKQPDVLTIDVHAPLFGGDISGQARIEFNSSLRYELNLTASQMDLQDFGRHNLGPNPQLSGVGVGRLYLTGQGTGIDTLDGHGSIDVHRGKLYNLPLLLDLIKFLGLRLPDRTMFEEIHALFAINGRRVRMRRLDLYGNAVSLTGQGDFNLDGTELNLDFYPSWGRMETLLPPAVRAIPQDLSKSLLKIEMRGTVGANPGDLRFHKRPIPVLVDPLLQIRDRIKGDKGTKGHEKN
jgi:hypothetical protein